MIAVYTLQRSINQQGRHSACKKASGGKTKKQWFQGADVNGCFALRDDTGNRSSRLWQCPERHGPGTYQRETSGCCWWRRAMCTSSGIAERRVQRNTDNHRSINRGSAVERSNKEPFTLPAPLWPRVAHSGSVCRCHPLSQRWGTDLQDNKTRVKTGPRFNKPALWALPLVSGWIHDVAQLIFSGHPSNTLEKQAPIWN